MSNVINGIKSVDLIMIYEKLMLLLFLSAILFLVAYHTVKKIYTKKERKDVKNLISPILAEVLVDGKIDVKNLIMTTIIELQIRGNIEILDEDCMKLIHTENLTVYEHLLVDMIFEKNNVIKFKDINSRFKIETSLDFERKINNISNEILSQLYKLKLLSRKKMVILNLVCYFAMLLLINYPSILSIKNFDTVTYWIITIGMSVIATGIYMSKLFTIYSSSGYALKNISGKERNISLKILIGIAMSLTIFVFADIGCTTLTVIETLSIYILNFITFGMSQNNVLSIEGLKEKEKILELKNYLVNYNLIKNDNSEPYIIWDEYFAYSVAFGIPNPVTTKIYNTWDGLNTTLQFIDKLI